MRISLKTKMDVDFILKTISIQCMNNDVLFSHTKKGRNTGLRKVVDSTIFIYNLSLCSFTLSTITLHPYPS